MPIISKFFGIVIRLFYDEHNPPHLHAEYQNEKAVFDLQGNIIKGHLYSKTARKLIKNGLIFMLQNLRQIGNYQKPAKK